jgi:HAMP domain-containing protein
MGDLPQRLREDADSRWPRAQAVSNLNKPATDNCEGRTCTLEREAADEISRLTAELEELRWAATLQGKTLVKTVEELEAAQQRVAEMGDELKRVDSMLSLALEGLEKPAGVDHIKRLIAVWQEGLRQALKGDG